MDIRLLQASLTGDTQLLHQLVAENSLILHRIAQSPSLENPLLVASTAGFIDFAKEILRLRPDFSTHLDQDGFSPIHAAAANGHSEIVSEILRVDRGIISRWGGRNKWTPLHVAASRGQSSVIRAILGACPESIEDVTVQNESALHVAAKNGQSEALRVMLEWVRETRKDEILNVVDESGNSVLHLAVWKKNRQAAEWLLESAAKSGNTTLVNGVNKSGLTPIDVLRIFPSEAGDREIDELLRNSGAKSAKEWATPLQHSPSSFSEREGRCQDVGDNPVEYFKFKKGRDTPSDARTALLVMAVLVATATFQVGINPPGGIWQETTVQEGHAIAVAGKSILGSHASRGYLLFVIFNSLGLSVSLYMLTVLTSDFPMRLEFEICVVAIYVTYYTALGSMAPDGYQLFLTVFSAVVPATIHFWLIFLRKLARKLKWLFFTLFPCVLRC